MRWCVRTLFFSLYIWWKSVGCVVIVVVVLVLLFLLLRFLYYAFCHPNNIYCTHIYWHAMFPRTIIFLTPHLVRSSSSPLLCPPCFAEYMRCWAIFETFVNYSATYNIGFDGSKFEFSLLIRNMLVLYARAPTIRLQQIVLDSCLISKHWNRIMRCRIDRER